MILAVRRAARRADLVHANWLAGTVVARFAGRPFIVTLHGSPSAGRFSDFALAERAPRLVRLLLRRARTVICCSEQLATAMRTCGLENVRANPYGVDVPDELGPEDPPRKRKASPTSCSRRWRNGKTVIATPVGGIPTVIEDGVTGFLVPVGDAVERRAAIERALADPVLRKRVGDAARVRVSEYCSWDNVTARTLEIYAAAA